MSHARSFWVYILRSQSNGRYYTGQTNNLTKRLSQHNNSYSAATRGRGPYVLVHSEVFENRKAALARERYLKSLKNRAALEKELGL